MRVASLLKACLVAGIVGGLGYLALAWRPSIAETDPGENTAFDPEVVENGRIIAAAGYCVECHTSEADKPFAGNYAMVTPFGAIYGSNITPDRETGIGAWSPEAFRRAMHEAVNRRGQHLYPAFPFDHFTKMTDEDVDAVYAYLMASVTPVKQETNATTIPFPFSLRIWQYGWKTLFVRLGRFEPDPNESEEWNRGAYLVEGVAHCGACHTPRNLLGAEKRGDAFGGAYIDGWNAPPLTGANPSGVPWSAEEFQRYLTTGAGQYHSVAAGPMGPVIHGGMSALPESDIRAISVYLASKVGAPDADPAANPVVMASLKAGAPDPTYRETQGGRLYMAACASCHYNGSEVRPGRPELGILAASRLDDPSNLIQVMLNGVSAKAGTQGVVMPAFRDAMTDEDLAAIADHIRQKHAQLPPWQDLTKKIAGMRAKAGE